MNDAPPARLEALGRRTLAWPGVVFLVVIGQLAVCNAFVLRRNLHKYAAEDRPGRTSTDLKKVASKNPQEYVKWGFTLLYELRALHGATLVSHRSVPLDWFMVERVSRLHVEYTETPLQISQDSVKRLWETVTVWGRVNAETQMVLIERPGATRYVAAAVDGNPTAFFIMPDDVYAREAEPGHALGGKL